MSKLKQIDLIDDKDIQKGSPLGVVARNAGQLLGEFQRLTKEHGGLLTIAHAGVVLGLSHARVWNMINQGQLTVVMWNGRKWLSGKDVERRLKIRLETKAREDVNTEPKLILAQYRDAKAMG